MSRHEPLPTDYFHNDGSRKSGKSDNPGGLFLSKAMTVIDTQGEFVKASAIVIKKKEKTLLDVFEEYSKFARGEIIEPKVLKSKMRWEYANGNYVKFKPWLATNGECLNKQGSGWASLTGEYIFIVLEEAYELTPQDRQDIMEAVRSGNKQAKILFICICNPWYPNNPYIKFLNKHLPYNKHILMMQGYQYKLETVNELEEMGIHDEEFKPERHLFIHNNWRINPQLTQFDINAIKKSKILRPQEADTADYGVPGYGAASCYGILLDNIEDAVWEHKDIWLCGGDEGLGTQSSGKTSFGFQGFNYSTRKLDRYDEYVWDNTMCRKPAGEQAKEIVDFYTACREEYFAKTGEWIEALFVRVDKSAISFLDTLNAEVRTRQLDWIEFVPCSKYEIRDRVLVDNYLMSNFMFRVDKQRCKNYLEEASNAVWDDKQTIKPKRKDKADHSINDHEYGIEPLMYNGFITDDDMKQIYSFFSKRGKTNIKQV